MAIPAGFRALPLPLTQLSLAAVLKCGQSFRWSVLPLSDPVEYRFALRDRVVCLRQSEEMLYYRAVFPDANAHTQMDDLHTLAWLRDYFQLDVDLEHLYDTWSDSDPVFSKFRSRFKGIRMLRQDPWECLVSFICSQNNHISRITKMVESLCACFSPPVLQAYHPFPTPSALASPKTSSILRGLGFGYRAEYIQRTAQMLVDEHGAEGAEPFLMGLRDKKAEVAREELLKFVGVGRKVADCVLLMSLDKHDIVPVDTHVHKIAIKHYGLRTATMNPKLYQEIQMKFAKVWGDYAGWAHTVLFTADLKSFSAYGLPTPSPSVSPEKGKRKRSTKPEEESPRPRRHIAKESSLKEEPEVKEEGDLADRVKRRRARRTVAKQSMIYVEPIPA